MDRRPDPPNEEHSFTFHGPDGRTTVTGYPQDATDGYYDNGKKINRIKYGGGEGGEFEIRRTILPPEMNEGHGGIRVEIRTGHGGQWLPVIDKET